MNNGTDALHERVIELEKRYEWKEASELYKNACKIEEDSFKKGVIQEKAGYALHRAAFQNDQKIGFLEGLKKASDAYMLAKDFFEQSQEIQSKPYVLRIQAFLKYLEHWALPDASEKLRLIQESETLKDEALESFWASNQKREYCKTYSQLDRVTLIRFFRESDPKVRNDSIERAVSFGAKAIQVLQDINDPQEAGKVHVVYISQLILYRNWVEEYWDEDILRARKNDLNHHLNEALRYAEEVNDDSTKAEYYIQLGTRGRSIQTPESHDNLLKALEHAGKTRDIFLKAITLAWIAYRTYWRAFIKEDPDQRIRMADEAMRIYDQSQTLFKILEFQYPSDGKCLEPYPGGYAEYYLDRAAWETDLSTKKELLKKAEELGLTALKNNEKMAIHHSISIINHILSRTYVAMAKLEKNINKKRILLEKAVEHRKIGWNNTTLFGDQVSWNRGIQPIYFGQIKTELSLIEQDKIKRIELLEEARSSTEKGLDWCYRLLPNFEKRRSFGNLAILSGYQDGYGTALSYLHDLTNDQKHLKKAIEVWHYSIEVAQNVPLFGRIAELYWKIAKTHDILTEYSEAAENFKQASENYLKAAENIPQLKDFYQDYSTYMQAWTEIEHARQRHREKQYGEAKKHYEKAAEIHEATKNWSYMSPNYHAWAKVEEAEDLSRNEKTEEARDAFRQAAETFGEAQESIRNQLKTIETDEERRTAEDLVGASHTRRQYCLGRIALEDARIMDRRGDHMASSRKYGESAKIFQAVMDSIAREPDKRELQPVIKLCSAWERMMQAEAQLSPSLYSEAAELFIKARETATDQTTRLLAQAHSSFCKALEAGTRFELTRETELFSEAKRHIEASTSYYLRAGQQTMSDYAGATGRFLDAYLYTYNAQTEADPVKKAQLYQMAERLLQSSAGTYLKAKHPEKSDEMRRILARVKEEREMAVSLSEVLHAPTNISSTTSFATPSPTHEQAVGLERFENADIQANLITRTREIGVGDDLDFEIELVNAGRAPAQLIKVEDVVIDGFELKSYSDICRVEDSYLDMKGRTLLPLKTQELKLVLQPISKGIFEFKPRVLYLDETGKYKSHEPEPVTITVQELGIKGWLKGPPR